MFCSIAHFSSFLHNYFGLTKLFSNMYLAKFLDQQNRSFCNSVKKGKGIEEKGNRLRNPCE